MPIISSVSFNPICPPICEEYWGGYKEYGDWGTKSPKLSGEEVVILLSRSASRNGNIQSSLLQKPKEGEEESRKSSTCHPGSISIKYSDMLLVEPPSTLANKSSPPLLLFVTAADVVLIDDDLASEVEFKIGVEAETEFLTDC